MSTTILRAIFATVFATLGFLLGRELFLHLISLHVASQWWLIVLTIASPVVGAVIGIFIAPVAQSIFEIELSEMERALEGLSPAELIGGASGLIVGLLIAWLIKSVLAEFGAFAGNAGGYIAIGLSILVSLFAAYLGARVGAKQRIGPLAHLDAGTNVPAKIIDTSIIVDGRIVEIVQAGFLEGTLVLPRFVLRELQLIADSADAQKRARGRRGLEVLAKLQEIATLSIDERDYDDVGGQVDAKLVRLARERGGKLVTNDYNLSRVANVEGVLVLSINDLAGAVKPVVLPGEDLHVAIIRDGKESGQGVGYLEDGTMIVVENGRRLIGEDVEVQVTSVLQTVAGRMIFAKLKRSQATGT
ncbi:MAG TPA: PIN domain-containing protein [Candidatus Baltobacteraceae bacterium]